MVTCNYDKKIYISQFVIQDVLVSSTDPIWTMEFYQTGKQDATSHL